MFKEFPKLLIADKNSKVYDIPDLEATGMKGGEYFRLKPSDLIELHPDSELFLLPSRSPVGYDASTCDYVELSNNPAVKGTEECFAVAAFPAPGHTTTYSASYSERGKPKMLPLFSYAAVSFYRDKFYVAARRVDTERRQMLEGMDMRLVEKGVKTIKKNLSNNRLVQHLEKCALTYGCPAAKNFFLNKYEGPLPASPNCNAICLGCISKQPGSACPVTQPRIKFIPSAEEIAEVALFHIKSVRDPVVSFGQGCEGEPLMVGDVLASAIKSIRSATSKGIININTNASKPGVIRRLFARGLDSIRVSMNSVRSDFYTRYYRPKGYTFSDVVKSILYAKEAQRFVSLNYLVMPGFTDSKREADAFKKFLDKYEVDMIQWRNLNYDPRVYFDKLKIKVSRKDMVGVDSLISSIKKEFPHLMHGYFNPSKSRMRRAFKGINA